MCNVMQMFYDYVQDRTQDIGCDMLHIILKNGLARYLVVVGQPTDTAKAIVLTRINARVHLDGWNKKVYFSTA